MNQDNLILKKNMLLNIMKTFLSIIFPLITYPYITRILLVENLGKISFTNSIVNYVALIASLGISSYAIREGGFFRKSKKDIDAFSSQVFSINLFTTFLSYVILFVLICLFIKSKDLKILLLIQGLSIVCTTFAVDWLNVIFEDYFFITIRSFFIQLFMLILVILFVKTPDDIYIYVCIQFLGNLLITVFNWIHIKKYCSLKFTMNIELKKHLKPIMILFSNTLAVSIYLNSDNVMIGIILTKYEVGLYAIAVKIYTIMKYLVAAMYNVTVTRMSEYIGNNEISKYKNILNITINNIIFVSIPIIIGIISISKTIIFFVGGNSFLLSYSSLNILALTILFAVMGGMIAYCINLPFKKEKINLIATSVSAIENIILNFFFIKKMGIKGAAIATLISEFTVFIILIVNLKDKCNLIKFRKIVANIIKTVISSVSIIIISKLIAKYFDIFSFEYLIFTTVLSVILFFSINLLLKNEVLFRFIKNDRKV